MHSFYGWQVYEKRVAEIEATREGHYRSIWY